MNWRAFWIRRDREAYFLSGVIITCTIGGFVSSYWHFTDRITVRKNITINAQQVKEAEQRKLRDVQYTPSKPRAGNTKYYEMGEETAPSVPRLGDDGR